MRSLRDSLQQDSQDIESVKFLDTCALDRRFPCCHGLGMKLSSHGPFAKADLCDCLKTCRNCLGHGHRIVLGEAKACRIPMPRRVVQVINSAELPSRYTHAQISSFANNSGNHQEILKKISSWLRKLETQNSLRDCKGLILGGHVGTGKTYLLVALAKRLALQGYSVRFIDFYQLTTQIKAQYGQSRKVSEDLISPLIEADVLLIDELGKGRQTEFEHTVIDQLIMGRYNQHKMLLASSNCRVFAPPTGASQGELDRADNRNNFSCLNFPPLIDTVGQRIYSRLRETCHFLEMTGNDYREENNS